MSFLKEFIERLKTDSSGLLQRLSASQKMILGLIAALVTLVLVLIIQPRDSSDGEYATLRMNTNGADMNQLLELQNLLEEGGVKTRIQSVGTSNLALQVQRSQLPKARWLTADQSSADNLGWLYESGQITDSPDLRDKRYLDSRKREVVATIIQSSKIASARLLVEKNKVSPFATRSNLNDTASVHLGLSAGVDRLTKKEAATVRRLVSGAFNLLPENIQVSDSRLHHYQYLEAQGGVALSDEQDRLKNEVHLTLQRLYGAFFKPSEFVVGVLVDLSQERSRVSQTDFDPEAIATQVVKKVTTKETGTRRPGNPVGTAPNASASLNPGAVPGTSATGPSENEDREISESTSEVRFSEKKTETEIPAGKLQGVSVNLVLDRNAVLRVLQEDGKFLEEEPADEAEKQAWRQRQQAAIEAFVSEHDGIVKAQFPASVSNVTTKVSVVSFPRPPETEEVAFAGSFTGWFSEHWKDLGLGVIALVVLLVFLSILKRTVPAPVEIPSLEDRILLEEDRQQQEELQVLRKKISEFTKEEDQFVQEVTENELEQNLERIHETASTRPESVAAVLRTWMSGASADDHSRAEELEEVESEKSPD